MLDLGSSSTRVKARSWVRRFNAWQRFPQLDQLARRLSVRVIGGRRRGRPCAGADVTLQAGLRRGVRRIEAGAPAAVRGGSSGRALDEGHVPSSLAISSGHARLGQKARPRRAQ